MKHVPNELILSPLTDKPLVLQRMSDDGKAIVIPPTLANVIWFFFEMYPARGVGNTPAATMQDVSSGNRLITLLKPYHDEISIDEATAQDRSVIHFEDADHAWLLKNLEERGPVVFSFNVQAICEGLKKTSALVIPPKNRVLASASKGNGEKV